MSQTIETLELNIKAATKTAELGKSFDRLSRNKDFKSLILDAYFEKEAIRLVTLKGDPNMQDSDNQAALLKQMDAIGGLRQYLSATFQLARMAEKALVDDENTRDEVYAEEV
jgi:hypothetical protein